MATHTPSIGILVGRAAATLDEGKPETALRYLDDLQSAATDRYQPYWVTRANTLAAMKRFREARQYLQTAIGLTEDRAVRAYLSDIHATWQNER